MTLQLNTNFVGVAAGLLSEASLAPNWQFHTNPDARPDLFVVGSDSTGAYVRFTLPGTGNTTGYRTEFNTQQDVAGFTSHYDNGEELYASIRLRVVEVPEDGANGETTVMQVHQVNPSSLSPPAVIFIRNGCWCARLLHSYVVTPTSNSQLLERIYNLGPVRVNQVETFVVRYAVQSVTAGTVEIWRNGVKHVSQTDVPTRYDLSSPNFIYLKCGLYAYPWSGGSGGAVGAKHVMDMYSFKVGTAYVDVA